MIKNQTVLTLHARRNRIIKVLLTIIIVLLVVYFATYDPHSIGYWRSAEGQKAYEAAYAEAMQALPLPTHVYDIPTSYGTVRVYYWENEHTHLRTPAVFLPGRSSGVPMWADNLPAIAATRPVYAMDALGDAGLSQQTAVLNNAADQAAWLDQVFQALQLESAHLLGHSFGGWAAANYATHHPRRVASLTLLEPVFTFQGLNWDIYLKSIPASLPFLPKQWREGFLKDIGGANELDLSDPRARMIAYGTEHYAAKLPLPEQPSAEQLQGWSMPVYIALAGNSAIHDSTKALAVAKQYVPHGQAKLWLQAGHSLPMEQAAALNQEIIDFLAASELTS